MSEESEAKAEFESGADLAAAFPFAAGKADELRIFAVVARAPAKGLFRPGEALGVQAGQGDDAINCTFRTRYRDLGTAVPVPGDLWLEAKGVGTDIHEVATRLTNMGGEFAAFLASVANVYIGALEPEIVIESKSGSGAREYFQRYLEPDRYPDTNRFFDP